MALTQAQLTTLKAHIDASSDLNVLPNTADGNYEVAALLNAKVSPDFYVWKQTVTEAEILQNGMDWLRVDNLSVGKSRIWEWMFKFGSVDPSKVNVRTGIREVWKGTAADNVVALSVFGHCQTLATRVQKLFGTGAGTVSTVEGVGPATAEVWTVSWQDCADARNLP